MIYSVIKELSCENLIKYTVSVYGKLVELGGINISQIVEEHVNQCIGLIINSNYKFKPLHILVELMKHAHFLTFNLIRKSDKYIKLFKLILMEKKLQLRIIGYEFLNEFIKETSKRDSKWPVQPCNSKKTSSN